MYACTYTYLCMHYVHTYIQRGAPYMKGGTYAYMCVRTRIWHRYADVKPGTQCYVRSSNIHSCNDVSHMNVRMYSTCIRYKGPSMCDSCRTKGGNAGQNNLHAYVCTMYICTPSIASHLYCKQVPYMYCTP